MLMILTNPALMRPLIGPSQELKLLTKTTITEVARDSSTPGRRATEIRDGIHADGAGHTLGSAAFCGFLMTQFLGAFNDNYFKQMVLLICVSNAATLAGKHAAGPDRQFLAMAAFALPFVLLSGLGGFLSDRFSKRRVIVGSKVAEIVIMALAFLVLLIPGLSKDAQLMSLIAVLCLMGAQSAIFGPSKYGILPELFRHDKLLPANGAVQMTTFLAIIFGTVCAGVALDQIRTSLWIGSFIAVGIAVAGTIAALLIPKTPVAEPLLKIRADNFAVPADVIRLLSRQRGLLQAVLVASVFWFLGGVTQMAVNTLGTSTLRLSSTRTSLMVAGIGFGIAAGCLVTGYFGNRGNGSRWVTAGGWLLFVSLSLIAILGSGWFGVPWSFGRVDANMLSGIWQADRLEWSLRLNMFLLGFAAGMFVVPIQVYLQHAPPGELKGRVLGAQNMVTWIGILMSAAYFGIGSVLLKRIFGPNGESQYQWLMFLSLAVVMLPICLCYRLPNADAQKFVMQPTRQHGERG